jgi:hypothetical protein
MHPDAPYFSILLDLSNARWFYTSSWECCHSMGADFSFKIVYIKLFPGMLKHFHKITNLGADIDLLCSLDSECILFLFKFCDLYDKKLHA